MQAHLSLALAGALLPAGLAAQTYDCRQSYHCGDFFTVNEDLGTGLEQGSSFEARLACEAPARDLEATLSLPDAKADGRFDFQQLSRPVSLDSRDGNGLYMTMRPGKSLPAIVMHFDKQRLALTTTRISREGPTIAQFTCKETE